MWDENWFGSTKTLDVHVAAVRRKLTDAADGTHAQLPTIATLRGHGRPHGVADDGSGRPTSVRDALVRPFGIYCLVAGLGCLVWFTVR